MTAKELLEEWLTGTRIEISAHYEAAKLYERYHHSLGFPTVIASALTGTSIVATFGESSVVLLKSIAIVLSLCVTVLTSLQTFLQYSARSDAHKATAVELSKLRREVEQSLVLEADFSKTTMDGFRTRWDEVSKAAPSIPDAIYKRHAERVCKSVRAGKALAA